jgi:hypothetical protein
MSVPFGSNTYFSKNLFRRSSGVYPLSSISYFYCGGLGNFDEYTPGENLNTYLTEGEGDFEGFFTNIPNVETIHNSFNLYSLNFNTLDLTPLKNKLKVI